MNYKKYAHINPIKIIIWFLIYAEITQPKGLVRSPVYRALAQIPQKRFNKECGKGVQFWFFLCRVKTLGGLNILGIYFI